jgi:hypothetical protein
MNLYTYPLNINIFTFLSYSHSPSLCQRVDYTINNKKKTKMKKKKKRGKVNRWGCGGEFCMNRRIIRESQSERHCKRVAWHVTSTGYNTNAPIVAMRVSTTYSETCYPTTTRKQKNNSRRLSIHPSQPTDRLGGIRVPTKPVCFKMLRETVRYDDVVCAEGLSSLGIANQMSP